MENYQEKFIAEKFKDNKFRLIDSMLIVIAQQGKRFKARVAPKIADAGGYCTSKILHYYGVKLHIVGCAQSGSTLIPEIIGTDIY